MHILCRSVIIGSTLTFKEVFSLKKLYGHRIRVLHWCTDQTMSDTLVQMDLTAAQGHIMGFLSRQTESPCARDIAEEFQLSHPTVSGLLSRLEKKGFIAFLPDQQDKRSRRIHVLPKGHECVERIVDTIHANEQRMVQDFSEEEKKLFLEFLDRAIVNMGGSSCPPHHKKEESSKHA